MIKGIRFVTMSVRDQNHALEFYAKRLGMSVLTDSPFDDTQR
jgi:catechol 2,3-dioxygenase-like lactoylglutathione lyase family enzyme